MNSSTYRWRTVDIVVTAVVAVAFGVVFWAWNQLWFGPFNAAFAGFPPAGAAITGVWFLPAVLAPLIVRKPGAALFAELVAAIISALLGSAWGVTVLYYGLAQGAAGELGFAIGAYKRWGLPNALLTGGLIGAAATILDLTTTSYGEWSASWQITYALIQIASGALIAGAGSFALARGLSSTGVLDPFPSGRTRELV
ncbi:ECF transporter S component [Hamadaea sp. NPDC050747]|uniref:ECF transporter S component n=1 Tax=Hamadaea sp. NPDC050747 TaxID=3155789 RepID=UPI0033C70882